MKKLLLTTLTAVALTTTTATAGFFSSDDTFIDTVEDKEFISKVYGDVSYLEFDNEDKLYINGTDYDIKLDKNNHLTLSLNGEIVEKSYVSNYKDEAILFDVYFQYEEKTKRQSLYINKKLWLNPRSCDREIVTTQEAFQHFKKKYGRVSCPTLSSDTKKYYINKIKSQKILKDLEGKWKDKNSKTIIEFNKNGNWYVNSKKQGMFFEDKEFLLKLNHPNGYSYSYYYTPYFEDENYKKSGCIEFKAYNSLGAIKSNNYNLCKQ